MPRRLVRDRLHDREIYYFYTGAAIDSNNIVDLETIMQKCEVACENLSTNRAVDVDLYMKNQLAHSLATIPWLL
jgi:hypothetical protein